jgi:hypothetical protein
MPASQLEPGIGVRITTDVASDLGCPELGVPLGRPVVLSATMPETPVYEHGHLGLREHQVRRTPDPHDRPHSDPVAKT